jgi:hypothetical protein
MTRSAIGTRIEHVCAEQKHRISLFARTLPGAGGRRQYRSGNRTGRSPDCLIVRRASRFFVAEPRRLRLPVLRHPTLIHCLLLGPGVALLGPHDDARVHQLPGHGEIAPATELPIEKLEQAPDRGALGQQESVPTENSGRFKAVVARLSSRRCANNCRTPSR